MKAILGEKIGMLQIFDKEGNVIPVTLVKAVPNTVVQVKTKEKDGYEAVQFGAGWRKEKNIRRPQKGHFKNLGNFEHSREFRLDGKSQIVPMAKPSRILDKVGTNRKKDETTSALPFAIGAKLDVSQFQEGDIVKISGISKAKGFQGVVKRHGFHGAPATHGTKHAHRQPGSIGPTWPQRVIKGRRMAGRMGGERITVRNLTVAKIDTENNLIAVKGAIPGRRGTLIEIRG